jgi:hypothetical protein
MKIVNPNKIKTVIVINNLERAPEINIAVKPLRILNNIQKILNLDFG